MANINELVVRLDAETVLKLMEKIMELEDRIKALEDLQQWEDDALMAPYENLRNPQGKEGYNSGLS